jgi:hypothetical protein
MQIKLSKEITFTADPKSLVLFLRFDFVVFRQDSDTHMELRTSGLQIKITSFFKWVKKY